MPQKETMFHSNEVSQQQYDKVQFFLEDGDLESALEATRVLLAEDGEDPNAWCLEGIVRLALGELQAAERSFDRACALSPEDSMPLLHKSRFLLTVQEFEEATSALEAAIQCADSEEEEAEALFLLSQALLGQAESLIEQWQEELEQGDEDFEAQMGYAPESEEGQPLPDEVVSLLERGLYTVESALERDSERPDGWLWKAYILSTLGQFEEAIEGWKKAIELDPENAFFFHELGSLYLQVGENELAQDAFDHLYNLELQQHKQEGMEFATYEFEEIAKQACDDLQDELLEGLGISIPFSLAVEEFPTRELIEQASQEEPFDPWTTCHVEIGSEQEDSMSLDFLLFQRNVERQLLDDSPENLYRNLFELLNQILIESLSLVENEEVIEA